MPWRSPLHPHCPSASWSEEAICPEEEAELEAQLGALFVAFSGALVRVGGNNGSRNPAHGMETTGIRNVPRRMGVIEVTLRSWC